MTGDTTLASLLPRFRQCDNYSDRLAFWQEYGLTEELSYSTEEFDNDADDGKASIGYGLRMQVECRTWEDVKQWPILTLTPFTSEDAAQFAEWALQVRHGMNHNIVPFETLRDDFLSKHQSYDFTQDQNNYLARRKEESTYWREGKLAATYAQSSNVANLIGINLDLFKTFFDKHIEKQPLNLASHIRKANVHINWQEVDTYLFAQSKYQFAVFLERFDPADNPPPLTSTATKQDKEQGGLKTLEHYFTTAENLETGDPHRDECIFSLYEVIADSQEFPNIEDALYVFSLATGGLWEYRTAPLSAVSWLKQLFKEHSLTDSQQRTILSHLIVYAEGVIYTEQDGRKITLDRTIRLMKKEELLNASSTTKPQEEVHSYPVFSYYNPFTKKETDSPFLLNPFDGGIYYKNSDGEMCAYAAGDTFRVPIPKKKIERQVLSRLLDRLGLYNQKEEILNREEENLILPLHASKHSGTFTLTHISDKGVIGLNSMLQDIPVFIAFEPTDEQIEWAMPEKIYHYSNEEGLHQFLDYHFNESPVPHQRFFEYLSGYVKRRLPLDVAYNVKPAKLIVDWIKNKKTEIESISEWVKDKPKVVNREAGVGGNKQLERVLALTAIIEDIANTQYFYNKSRVFRKDLRETTTYFDNLSERTAHKTRLDKELSTVFLQHADSKLQDRFANYLINKTLQPLSNTYATLTREYHTHLNRLQQRCDDASVDKTDLSTHRGQLDPEYDQLFDNSEYMSMLMSVIRGWVDIIGQNLNTFAPERYREHKTTIEQITIGNSEIEKETATSRHVYTEVVPDRQEVTLKGWTFQPAFYLKRLIRYFDEKLNRGQQTLTKRDIEFDCFRELSNYEVEQVIYQAEQWKYVTAEHGTYRLDKEKIAGILDRPVDLREVDVNQIPHYVNDAYKAAEGKLEGMRSMYEKSITNYSNQERKQKLIENRDVALRFYRQNNNVSFVEDGPDKVISYLLSGTRTGGHFIHSPDCSLYDDDHFPPDKKLKDLIKSAVDRWYTVVLLNQMIDELGSNSSLALAPPPIPTGIQTAILDVVEEMGKQIWFAVNFWSYGGRDIDLLIRDESATGSISYFTHYEIERCYEENLKESERKKRNKYINDDRGLFETNVHAAEYELFEKEIRSNFCKLAGDTKAQDRYANYLVTIYEHPVGSAHEKVQLHLKTLTDVFYPLDQAFVGKEKTDEQNYITLNWLSFEALASQLSCWKDAIEKYVENFSPEIFEKRIKSRSTLRGQQVVKDHVKQIPSTAGREGKRHITTQSFGFESYIKEEYRAELIPYLKEFYTNKKPKFIAPMLYAMEKLGCLTNKIDQCDLKDLHRELTKTLTNVGQYSGFHDAVKEHDPVTKHPVKQQNIEKLRTEIAAFLRKQP